MASVGEIRVPIRFDFEEKLDKIIAQNDSIIELLTAIRYQQLAGHNCEEYIQPPYEITCRNTENATLTANYILNKIPKAFERRGL